MPGDFQHFIKSQACKSYALFCELADMKKSKKITFTAALEGGEAAAPTGVWEGGLQHLGKKTLDMASHYDHENNSEENH